MASELLAGRYRLGPVLAESAVAIIYRAQDASLGHEVAVKVLRPELAEDEQVRARFLREARIAAELNHPNIVRVFDCGEAAGRPYIVMEYLPEPSLKEILVRYAPLDERKVAQLGVDCAKALDYIHRRGLVHRDVKPQNILFSSQGIAKLADFGIAAAVGERTLSLRGTVTGTAAYMSPEQAQGRPASAQSDIYSLGCVLYEALSGRPPYTGSTPQAVMRKHLTERPRPLRALNPAISPSMEFIVQKAMARDPSRRYATAAELMEDLAKVAAGQELDRTGILQTAPPARPRPAPVLERPSPSTATPPPSHRPPLPAIALGLILVVAVLVAIGWVAKRAFYPGQAPHLVQVPSVKGLPLHKAREKLAAHGLKVGNITWQESNLYEDGAVIDQRPEMGSTVETGTEVALVVRRGTATVKMIDLTGMKFDDAVSRLERLGLTLGEVDRRYDDTLPKDRIIKQSVEPGTAVEKGSPVDLVVSKGPEPAPEAQEGAQQQPDAEQPAEQTEESSHVIPYPEVDITDTTPDRGADEEHVYEIRITVLGKRPQQEVMVIAQDASGRRTDLLREKLDPQTTKRLRVKLIGQATIKVFHEGNSSWKNLCPPPKAKSFRRR